MTWLVQSLLLLKINWLAILEKWMFLTIPQQQQQLQQHLLLKPLKLIWCNLLCLKTHNNLEVRRWRIGIRKTPILRRMAKKPNKLMLGAINPKEMPSTHVWFLRKIISPNIVLTLWMLKSISKARLLLNLRCLPILFPPNNNKWLHKLLQIHLGGMEVSPHKGNHPQLPPF